MHAIRTLSAEAELRTMKSSRGRSAFHASARHTIAITRPPRRLIRMANVPNRTASDKPLSPRNFPGDRIHSRNRGLEPQSFVERAKVVAFDDCTTLPQRVVERDENHKQRSVLEGCLAFATTQLCL